MLKARGDLDLASEPLRVDFRARIRREDLDDDTTGQRGVGYQEDVRHAAATELALDGEGRSERRLKTTREIRHVPFRASRCQVSLFRYS